MNGALFRIVLCLLLVLPSAGFAQQPTVNDLIAEGDASFDAGDAATAESRYRAAMDLAEGRDGPESEAAIGARTYLITTLVNLDKAAEAEHLIRRQLDAARRTYGEESLVYAATLLQLGGVLSGRNDDAAAEPLLRRAVAIFEKLPDVDPATLQNAKATLAATLTVLGKTDEAEALLAGAGDVDPATRLLAAGTARQGAGDNAGALDLYRQSLAILEKTEGPRAYGVAIRKAAIAGVLLLQEGDMKEARALLSDAIAITEAKVGPDHPDLVSSYSALASVNVVDGDWQGVIDATSRATAIVEKWAAVTAGKDQRSALQLDSSQSFNYRLQAYAAWRLFEQEPSRINELLGLVFESFQRADSAAAAQALLRMAERRAESDPAFAPLMRRFQDLSQKVAAEHAEQLRRAAEPGNAQVFSGITTTEVELAQVKAQIDNQFSGKASGTSMVLSWADAAALLKPREALVLLGEGIGAEGTGMALAVTRDNAWWININNLALKDAAARLRLSLGATANARGVTPAPDADGPEAAHGFDFQAAADVYAIALAPLADALKEADHLIIVPSPGFFDVPFAAALEKMPDDPTAPTALRDAAWLIRRNAISILPSVASLKALRELPPEGAGPRPMAGFGNAIFSGAEKDLPQLPDTRDEVERMAASLAANGNRLFLGNAASEHAVKSAALDGFGVLAFATHGLKAGELAGLQEPALALTPGEGEDGFLTASEVANLKLDADWVILSACNTAAGETAGEEGFSGLARAFLYAGARSLLVSHWPVYSDAAVKLTTGAFAALAKDPAIGRAEALRRSMLAILDRDPNPAHWNPTYWAPFALLGDGG